MVKLIIGHIRKAYKFLDDNSIDCVITSPPYWRQRDYGVDGQIGQEEKPEQYASEIANVFSLLWDKLKKTATIFLNIGYKYYGEEFLLIPEMVAFEMRKIGYVLKNKIIWYKPNAMPTPARNRLNNTYEVVLFFVKNIGREVYYFNLEALADLFTRVDDNSLKLEDLLLARVEDNISSREGRTGIVKAVNSKAIKVYWDYGGEQIFEFAWEQKDAIFRCVLCSEKLNFWDIILQYANYEKFSCRYCGCEKLPIPELPTVLLPANSWTYVHVQKSELIYKDRITNAKESKKYKKAGILASSPAGRLALTGEKIVIKRKWIFPQPLIADYLKEKIKEKGLTVNQLEKLMGYEYTAAHWLRKDFSYWGKGGSLPRPGDWLKLKAMLGLDNTYDRLICDLVAMISTVRRHPKGKNIGDVWEIATEPYEGEHFSVFPKRLVERCIKIGCPPGGVVLDPFAGSGTVGEVAKKLGRHAILVEINPEYKKLIERRCGKVETIEGN